MLVVSDTSPLSNLAIIGRLDLLLEQFQIVRMPSAVARELSALPLTRARLALANSLSAGWLVEMAVPVSVAFPDILAGLNAGEIEAIRLALALKADRILMDEKEGRRRAAALGLRTIGVIGVLIAARQTGSIASLAVEIARLRAEAGFFVDGIWKAEHSKRSGNRKSRPRMGGQQRYPRQPPQRREVWKGSLSLDAP